MKYIKGIIALLTLLLVVFPVFAQEDIPTAQYPVLTTSAGQSADINTVNIILDQAGVTYDYCDVPTVEMVKKGSGLGGAKSGTGFHVELKTDNKAYPTGTAYKTVIFAIGASLKGMGASGLTVRDEEKRLEDIIKYCKKEHIFIIAVHSGGSSKRGAAGSDNERMIDTVAPYADLLIVVKDSNKDGRFTDIARTNNITLEELPHALAIVNLMKQVFSPKAD